MENPHVDIIAHPPAGYWEAESRTQSIWSDIQAALRTGTALEINAMPQRLDLKDIHAFRARELGVRMAVATDAHRVEHLGLMRYGVGVARRPGARQATCLTRCPPMDRRTSSNITRKGYDKS